MTNYCNLPKSNEFRIILPLSLLFLLFLPPDLQASLNDDYFMAVTSKYNVIFKYDSKTFFDITRKDYYKLNFSSESQLPDKIPMAYDKSFITNHTDLMLSFKYNLSDYQFLDFDQIVYFSNVNREDAHTFTLDSPKFEHLDSKTNIIYGIAIGQEDALQLKYSFYHYRIPTYNLCNFNSNELNARIFHQLSEYSALGIEGNYLEKDYEKNKSYSFKEATITLDWAQLFPTKYLYTPVSNSLKGSKEELLKYPTAINHKKIIDYYTTYTTKEEDKFEGKFVKLKSRGETQLLFALDLINREYTKSDIKYFQPQVRLDINYDFTESFKLNLSNTYYKRRHEREDKTKFYLDHSYDRIFLKLKHLDNSFFTYYYTLSNQRYYYSTDSNFNKQTNTASIEIWYNNYKTLASLAFTGERSKQSNQQKLYPNSELLSSVFTYDYNISNNLYGHLKIEYIDLNYKANQTRLFSSNIKKSWYTALEHRIFNRNRVELGYFYNNEVHKKYEENNKTEKTLMLTFKSNF